jgi:hypothetical protein
MNTYEVKIKVPNFWQSREYITTMRAKNKKQVQSLLLEFYEQETRLLSKKIEIKSIIKK